MKSDKFETAALIVLLLAAALPIASAILDAGHTDLTVWGDRDLWRALQVGRHWPVLGPETNGGVRTPGGAFYLLLAGLLAIDRSYLAANLGVIGLFAASTVLLWAFFRREVSPLAGALVAAVFAGSGTLALTMGVWNPAYVLVFSTLATLAGYRFIKTGQAAALGVAAAALAIGLQIHLQIFQLAIGLVVAAALYRPRLDRRQAVALAAGLVLPYLPTLTVDSLRSLTEAAALPGDALASYGSWQIDLGQKAKLVFDLFGGAGGAFAILSQGRFPELTKALGAADLLALGLALWMALAAIGSLIRNRRHGRAPDPVGVFTVITVVYLTAVMFTFVNIRHVVAVVPAAAAMVGLAAERLIGRRRSGSRLATAAALLTIGLLALRPLALGWVELLPRPFSTASAEAQTEIAATLKPRFYADHQDFAAHAALFQRYGRPGWQLVQGGLADHLAFIYTTTPVPPTEVYRAECMAILPKAGVKGDSRAELASTPALAALAAEVGELAAESPHFLYYPYTGRDGNCLKTFPNAYIATAVEAAQQAPGDAPGSRAELFAALPGQNFPLALELERDGADYRAVLHGRLLRGYTGLAFHPISEAVLCFSDGRNSSAVAFGKVTIGSPQTGTLAPWQSPRFSLPDGRFQVWLTGRDARQMRDVQIHFGSLSLPALQTAGPAADGPLPDGCPMPKRLP